MSKLSRYRRKVFRHRLIANDTFENIKDCVKACPRSINISLLAYYKKYAVRRDPERSRSDWRLQQKCRKWQNKHHPRSYPSGVYEYALQCRSMRVLSDPSLKIWPVDKDISEQQQIIFKNGSMMKFLAIDSLKALRSI